MSIKERKNTMADQVVQANEIFKLVRSISDAQWDQKNNVVNVRDLCHMAFAAAVQGRYFVVYQFPTAINQALVAEQNRQQVNLPASMYQEWKNAINVVFTTFQNSSFNIENVQIENGGLGFKLSWTETPEEVKESKVEAAKALETLIKEGEAKLVKADGTTEDVKDNIEVVVEDEKSEN